ncbi:MAG TPA: Crp/Fnr family transcriptional regulator [Devosia sp.]
MLHTAIEQSEARRLTDVLRAKSEPSVVFDSKGPVAEKASSLQIVLEGAVLRQRFLADGRRHTVAVYYQDDVINLGRYAGAAASETDYLLAVKGSVIGSVADDMVNMLRAEAAPGLDGVGVLVYRELGIAQERMTSLGQRSAIEAMAHFFCETLIRCARPLANFRQEHCRLQMTQEMLASVLGISSVHVNRVLQELRRQKLADIVDSELIVYDYERLAELAEFDDGYLSPI